MKEGFRDLGGVLKFEWDERKAEANLAKHDVSFEEAKSVLYDPFAKMDGDPDHSISENRYITVGYSDEGRLLFVCHTYRGRKVRIISARRATKTEIRKHEAKAR